MPRPDDRPLRRLPTLAPRKTALETCVFCPKLCRSACPVSNAEPRETLTPWGKMSIAYFGARGDVDLEDSFARPAWACTSCFGCRSSCDHQNDVTGTLLDVRDALVKAGLGPAKARATIAEFSARDERVSGKVRALRELPGVRQAARDALLIGCGYVTSAPAEAAHAVAAATGLVRGDVALAERCCGLPLLLAGDVAAFVRQAVRFAEQTRTKERLLVADAGCALALRLRYPEHGVALRPKVELLVELAAKELTSLETRTPASAEPVRWHDPCQLGRGLGVYEAPRAVLTRVLGRGPAEFDTRREKGTCSGGGGLLPLTMPETSRTIAAMRLDEHTRGGGGRVVTACASSLVAMRTTEKRRGGGTAVDDIVTWIAKAVGPRSARG
jgi:Fe-S oxidoreductase